MEAAERERERELQLHFSPKCAPRKLDFRVLSGAESRLGSIFIFPPEDGREGGRHQMFGKRE